MMRFLRKLLVFMAIVFPLAFAFGVYGLKYKSVFYAEAIARTKAKIHAEKSAIAVMRAEIAYLEQPNLVTQAAQKYLHIKPMGVHQIANLKDLPVKTQQSDLIGSALKSAGVSKVEQNKNVSSGVR